MSTIQVGNILQLKVKKILSDGYVLTDQETDVFLTLDEATEEVDTGEQVEVFLFHDTDYKIVATMKLPSVRLSTFDWAEVVEVNGNLGVFVDIGIPRPVLVSIDELPAHQAVWPKVGDQLYITLKHDKKNRLLAEPVKEADFEGNWDHAPESLFNKDIKGRVFRSGKEGAVILTEDGYRGFIHHTERKEEPRVGEWVEGRVIMVKEDGTLNVSLLPRKQEAQALDADVILSYLKENGGSIPYDNQSDPEDIRKTFQMSKSAFKRAIGKLYKEKLIRQEHGKTFLIVSEQDKND